MISNTYDTSKKAWTRPLQINLQNVIDRKIKKDMLYLWI